METKILKNYIYEGLGFPVELEQVQMFNINGDWHPQIDVKKVADEVIAALAIQDSRLTGNHIKFIRSYYAMPLREFGEKVVHESHMAVSKWEKKRDLPTNMNANTEHELRLYIIEKLFSSRAKPKSKFYDFYIATKNFFKMQTSINNIMHIALRA